jgi:hypothetical protein
MLPAFTDGFQAATEHRPSCANIQWPVEIETGPPATGFLVVPAVRFWPLCKPLHSGHYAQFETMCSYAEMGGPFAYGAERSGSARCAHSYRVCKKRTSEFGDPNRRNLASSAANWGRAFSFFGMSALT